ncbi:MAG: hypothetical protein PHN80_16550, partial [Hespellia sp.]|nr:hypothetical protein [Hespellia sp.]
AADAKKYSDTVAKYDDANAKISSGNYAGALKELKGLSSAYSAAGGATTQQLQKQAEAYGKAYQGLKARQEAGDKNVTQEQVNAARTLAENAGAEYEKAGGKAGDKYVEGFKNSGIKMSAKEIQSEFKQFGYSLPDAAAKAFASKAPSVQAAAMQCLNSIQSGVQATEPQISAAFTALGVSLPEPIIKSFATTTPEMQAMIAYFFQNISSGVQLKSGELQALFSEMGVQIPRALLDSLSQQSPAAQKAAVELVGALESGISPGEAKLVSMFSAMGLESTTALLNGLSQMVPDGVKTINSMLSSMGVALNADGKLVYLGGKKAGQLVTSMSEITGGATLTGPHMGAVQGCEGSAQAAWNKMQAAISANPLHAKAIVDSYYANTEITRDTNGRPMHIHARMSANGRIATHPTLSTLCEEGYPEAVIPFNPARRGRALGLWQQTGKALGVMQNANGGIYGNVMPSNPKVSVSASMMASILGWARINTGKDDKLSEKIVEQAQKTLDNLKQYDELSTAEEVRFWEKVRKIRGLAGSQLNDIDHKIYEAKKANSQAIVSDAEAYLGHYKNIGKMTDSWELSYWQRTLNREGLFAEQKKAIEEKIYAAQKQYSQDLVSDLEKQIQHEEALHEISTDDELHYWQGLLSNRNLMADELDTVNEKIYEAEQKLKDEDKQQSEDEYNYFDTAIQDDVTFNGLDVQGQLNSWKSVYDDYEHGLIYMQDAEAKKVRVNIANLQKQIKEQQDDAVKEQQDNLKSRIDSLKSWTGLFDEPSYNWEISPDELMWNMKEQVRMMQNWQNDMATLQARGISSAMLKQLQDLGPAAADKIHALTEMTSGELQKYQALFNTKNNIATNEGTKELGIPSNTSVSVSLNIDNNSVAAVNNTVQTVVDTTEQAAAAIPAAVTNAVTAGMNNLESTVKDRMPVIIELFKKSGKDAGNAYGTGFVDRIKDSMNTFNGVVKSATDSAQAQLSTTLKAANDTSTAIDSLTEKVSSLELNAVYPNIIMESDGRQIAKAAGPYMGTVLKYKR